jgi:protein-disulfide isomerase
MIKHSLLKIAALGALVFVPAMQASAAPAKGAGGGLDDAQFEAAMQRYLTNEKGQEALVNALQNYSNKMREKQLTEQFEKGFANRAKIDIGNSPTKGPADAPITMVEFSDFQCPYCGRGRQTMEDLVKAYPGKIRVVFKNFPLPMHPEAMPAAKAAMAANRQGKFWEMHDAFFDNQQKLGQDFYLAKAKEIGLNVDKFQADMKDPEIDKAIKADQEVGTKNGVQGTPGFFLNGVPVLGAFPLDHFKKVVDRLLADTGKAKS